MVYNEHVKKIINKHIKNNWDEKYKEYYTNKTKIWRELNKDYYNDIMRKAMNKRNLYIRECKKFRNILLD